MDDTDDETLMLRYRDGDTRAFEALYARHRGPLYRYLLRQCAPAPVAEELFQDIWLRLIRARSGYTVQARFTTYLYRLAHNRLIDHYRSHGRTRDGGDDHPPLEDCPADPLQQPEALEERRRRVERLAAQVAGLPEAQREAFLLHAEAGLTLEAIAEVTGVGRETVKSRLRYAVARLRRGLGEDF